MARHAATESLPAPFRCPRCCSAKLVDFASQLVCGDCGAVMQAEPVELVRRRGEPDRDASDDCLPDMVIPPGLAVRAWPGVADCVEAMSGRVAVGRLIACDQVERVALQEGPLRTAGPVVFRHVQLVDQPPPHRPLAVCWELIVPDRLPAPVRRRLPVSDEPLDRLLTLYGASWRGEVCPEEGTVAPIAEASCDLSWAAPGGAVVEVLRRATVRGVPVAVLIDELPLNPQPFGAVDVA
jgi:hypothetical protein